MARPPQQVETLDVLQLAPLRKGDRFIAVGGSLRPQQWLGPLKVIGFERERGHTSVVGADAAGRTHTLMVQGQRFEDAHSGLCVKPYGIIRVTDDDAAGVNKTLPRLVAALLNQSRPQG